ncbi:general stress protein [Bacillus cereus]|uniref:general stress protein n=1 Tax=Bacillus anthracis TaxID=1392 RepID=UPI00253F8D61|nr:general stress protein [Bacillus anthracis]MDA2035907.1 general stress protein [Bacillus cereus]MDA2052415.1 general stress protein [Bacillus cereus]WIG22888.1 general stress protein [Bacillus anthracis]
METKYSKPFVYEFITEKEVMNAANDLVKKGIDQKDIYVLTHEKERTDRIADNADVNTIGIKEEGLGTSIINVFQNTGDQLRNKMQELGLNEEEANFYEEKLDEGKILLFVKDLERVGEWLQERRCLYSI